LSLYRTLSEQDAIAYARTVSGLFPDDAELVCQEIGDGNLNLVFRVVDEKSGKSLIFKQALPYARVVGESWPLTLDRARIEYEALMIENQFCPGCVPKVHHYDKDLALTVMDDLSSHIILRKGLVTWRHYPHFAHHIGSFLARTLFLTSDLAMDSQVKKKMVSQFINPEMCKITEDLVFTHPYGHSETNRFNPLISETVSRIWGNHMLKLEIAKLKEGFLTRTQALLHGDLHTGSIMITETDTRVIDPEFAFYGPMGFDIGTVIANLLLNYSSHVGHTPVVEERTNYQEYLLATIHQLWETFDFEFKILWEQHGLEPSTFVAGYLQDYLTRVLEDASGFAGCEMMRRVIGLAHVPDLESIRDESLRAKAETLTLKIAQRLVLNKSQMKQISDLTALVREISGQEAKS
jgi:5-methylthioribose kinase